MSTHTSTQSVTVGQVLSAIRRRLPTVVACMFVGGVLAGLYAATAAPSYSATAVVTLLTLPDNPLSTGSSTKVVNTATEAQVVRSTAIAQRVATALGTSTSPSGLVKHVTVTSPLNSQALQISFKSATAAGAARGANAFANAYLAFRSATVAQQVSTISDSLDKQIRVLNTQQEKAQVTALNGITDVQRANAKVIVETDAQVLQQLREQRAQLDNASTTAGQLVGQAEVPSAPAGLSKAILLAAGLAVGFVAGMVLALIRDRTDDHIRNREQIESELRLSVVADIPLGGDGSGVATPIQAEAYRRLAAIITSSQNVATTSPLLLVAAEDPGRRDIAAKLASAVAGQVGSAALICAPSAVAVNLAAAQMGIWHSGAPQVESFGDETELRNGRPLNASVSGAEMVVIDGINVEHDSTPLVLTSAAHSVLIVVRIGHSRMSDVADLVRELGYTGAHIQGVILLDSAPVRGRRKSNQEPRQLSKLPEPARLPGLGSIDAPATVPSQPPVRPSQQSAGYPDKGSKVGWEDPAAPLTQPIAVVRTGSDASSGGDTNGSTPRPADSVFPAARTEPGRGESSPPDQKPAKFMRLPSVREK